MTGEPGRPRPGAAACPAGQRQPFCSASGFPAPLAPLNPTAWAMAAPGVVDTELSTLKPEAYSAWCGAGWTQLHLYPGQPAMLGEVTVRAGDGRSSSIAGPLVKQIDDCTDVVVPRTGGCLGAVAVVYQAGHPAVTASLPCPAPPG